MKRLYLSGPMTGLPGFNFPAFHAEAARLRTLGYDVVNPAELNPDPGASWHACMRRDLTALLTCDAIALLDDWQGSAGAHLEMHVAHRVGMEIVVARDIVGVIGAAPVGSAWNSAADQLPDDDECVLIAVDGEVWTGFLDAGQWRYVSADPVGQPVTHWMRFPEPPACS